MAVAEGDRAVTVVVIGATGAVGRDLISALERSTFPIREVRAISSRRSAETELSFHGQPLIATALEGRGGRDQQLNGADLVIFATPPELARALAGPIAEQGAAVIEIGGGLADKVGLCLPSQGLDLERFDHTRILSTPWGPSAALATVLGPLTSLTLNGARGVALLSAGLAGHQGVDELSQQVVAMLNSASPPRKIFPTGLAFDLITPVGTTAEGDGWSETEQRIAMQTATLLDWEPHQIAVTTVLAPLFAGMAFDLHLSFEREPQLPSVRAALEQTAGIRFGDPVPGPRRLPGRSGLHVGRLRADPAGDGVHLWAAADNLRFGAAAQALTAANQLWREGRLGER